MLVGSSGALRLLIPVCAPVLSVPRSLRLTFSLSLTVLYSHGIFLFYSLF